MMKKILLLATVALLVIMPVTLFTGCTNMPANLTQRPWGHYTEIGTYSVRLFTPGSDTPCESLTGELTITIQPFIGEYGTHRVDLACGYTGFTHANFDIITFDFTATDNGRTDTIFSQVVYNMTGMPIREFQRRTVGDEVTELRAHWEGNRYHFEVRVNGELYLADDIRFGSGMVFANMHEYIAIRSLATFSVGGALNAQYSIPVWRDGRSVDVRASTVSSMDTLIVNPTGAAEPSLLEAFRVNIDMVSTFPGRAPTRIAWFGRSDRPIYNAEGQRTGFDRTPVNNANNVITVNGGTAQLVLLGFNEHHPRGILQFRLTEYRVQATT